MAFQCLYVSQALPSHLITKHGAILSRTPTVSHSFTQCHGEMFPHYVVAVSACTTRVAPVAVMS